MAEKNYFLNRYTVRNYSDKHISDDLLQQIITEAEHAPNTGNMQWYSVVATRSKELRAKLAPAHFNQPSVMNCDVLLTFCVDIRRFEHWCHLRKAKPGYDNFQSFIAAMIDTCIFAQQVCTIAEMRGIGTCYLGTTTYNAHTISEVLELPERVVPVTTLTLGYPAEEGKPSWRLPVDAVLHSETYHDTCDADIERYYAELEALPESAKFIAENGKDTLAQVFTDVRYTREAAEYFSTIYEEELARNGFIE